MMKRDEEDGMEMEESNGIEVAEEWNGDGDKKTRGFRVD